MFVKSIILSTHGNYVELKLGLCISSVYPELFIEIKKRERFLAYMQGKYYL